MVERVYVFPGHGFFLNKLSTLQSVRTHKPDCNTKQRPVLTVNYKTSTTLPLSLTNETQGISRHKSNDLLHPLVLAP